jgi:putative hydrolase of the HAD superfamily
MTALVGGVRALLFDAGGVLVLPDTAVLREVLVPYGASRVLGAYVRAHYGAMAAKSRAAALESQWDVYRQTYVESVGVPSGDQAEAAYVMGHCLQAHLWRTPIESSRRALQALRNAAVPIGVISNASGQIASTLRRTTMCQVGDGDGVPVSCVIDSHDVGVEKPEPGIFAFGLDALGLAAHEVGYVGDSVVIDVMGARAAGLRPILLDPFDDWRDDPTGTLGDAIRIRSLLDLVPGE